MIKTVCPHCGEEIEIATPETTRRGKLAGLSLSEMTDEQLKTEIINASSVLAKAKKRGAAEETILLAEARLAAAKEEKASRPSMAPKSRKKEETVDVVDETAEVEAEEIVEDVMEDYSL